jgi:hypothetical protein
MCKKRVATHNFLPCCGGANGDGDDGMKEEIQSDIMTGRTCCYRKSGLTQATQD